MNVDTFFNSLMVSDTNSLGLVDIALTMVVPLVLSIPVTLVYRTTQRNNNYSTSFVHSLFLFSSLSAIITLLIGSNIARAFGLVGALSIIRFRNALKEPIDAVYVFWSLAIGMACGTGFYMAAAMLTCICSAACLILHFVGYGRPRHKDSVLKVFTAAEQEHQAVPVVEQILKAGAKSYQQVNVLYDQKSSSKAYVYTLRTRRGEDLARIENTISSIEGVTGINHLNRESALFAD